MEDLPPYTCDNTEPAIEGGVALFDQNGDFVTAIEATACNADWICQVHGYFNLYPGVTTLTWRSYAEYLAEQNPPGDPPVDEPEDPAP